MKIDGGRACVFVPTARFRQFRDVYRPLVTGEIPRLA